MRKVQFHATFWTFVIAVPFTAPGTCRCGLSDGKPYPDCQCNQQI